MNTTYTKNHIFETSTLPKKPSFPLPHYLEESIDNLIAAIKANRIFLIPLYEEQVRADSRGLSDPAQEAWVIDYYHGRGWLSD